MLSHYILKYNVKFRVNVHLFFGGVVVLLYYYFQFGIFFIIMCCLIPLDHLSLPYIVFITQADSPDCTKIPPEDLVGVTVVLLTCSYKNQEFVRIGYYVNNEYTEQELIENPPSKPIYEKVTQLLCTRAPPKYLQLDCSYHY